MQIRKAKIGDVPRIAEMGVDFMRFHSKLDPYLTPAKDVKNIYLSFFRKCVYSRKKLPLAAVDRKKIVGYALAELSSRPPVSKIKKIGVINNIYLEIKYRRIGIAKKLLEEIYAWFRKNKISYIEMIVIAKN